jgi:uncharacterized membrane protein YphA (DoxX/SURF4 family)
MRYLHLGLSRAEKWVTGWVSQHGVAVLRTSVGIVFFWFGVLKFFPRLSPAEDLATRTISALSLGLIAPSVSLPVLAAWECLIGVALVSGQCLRCALVLMFVHMSGTITPLVLFPRETWAQFPFAATLEGQYIIKNLVLVSAALVVYAAVREEPAGDTSGARNQIRIAGPSLGGLPHTAR